MKTKTKNTPKQWAITTALMTVGFIAFLILCGEETPDNPMPLGQFFAAKIAALTVLGGCIKAGKYLHGKGLIVDMNEEDDEI